MTERRARGETRSPENYQNPSLLPDQKSTLDSGETAVDRISQLPDSLLLLILSLMPTDETLVTSALSKRWRHLCHEPEAYKSDIDRWYSFAVEKKVENVKLRSNSDEEVLCILQFKGVPIPELKCKYFTLELHTKKFSVYGAAGLLLASPHIETLNIDIAAMHPVASFCCFGLQDLVRGDNIDLQSWISSFVFPNLKNVKIAISSRICLMDHLKWSYVKNLFTLSEFLLKNASVLEKFVIISKRRCDTCSMNCAYKYLFPLAEKLLSFPRLSTNCVIIFQE